MALKKALFLAGLFSGPRGRLRDVVDDAACSIPSDDLSSCRNPKGTRLSGGGRGPKRAWTVLTGIGRVNAGFGTIGPNLEMSLSLIVCLASSNVGNLMGDLPAGMVSIGVIGVNFAVFFLSP